MVVVWVCVVFVSLLVASGFDPCVYCTQYVFVEEVGVVVNGECGFL